MEFLMQNWFVHCISPAAFLPLFKEWNTRDSIVCHQLLPIKTGKHNWMKTATLKLKLKESQKVMSVCLKATSKFLGERRQQIQIWFLTCLSSWTSKSTWRVVDRISNGFVALVANTVFCLTIDKPRRIDDENILSRFPRKIVFIVHFHKYWQ